MTSINGLDKSKLAVETFDNTNPKPATNASFTTNGSASPSEIISRYE